MCASCAGCRRGDLGAGRCVCLCCGRLSCLNFLSEPLPDVEQLRAAEGGAASASILDPSSSKGLTDTYLLTVP